MTGLTLPAGTVIIIVVAFLLAVLILAVFILAVLVFVLCGDSVHTGLRVCKQRVRYLATALASIISNAELQTIRREVAQQQGRPYQSVNRCRETHFACRELFFGI